ncbi:family 20 glycosylhydrolase [Clostridium estertheticum]|uniref:beta-N-acetylhexosaminidase n=1 Tax=Clostridium estertheticum TaxID=238834 RepID=A0AA47IAA4_9CLOT|nr:glycoside hydrolase family 20 zincin-like fold domain-containing protein [Clostridium estertheticum]MBU3157675.1 family 20 glycosylhydrolase [Clostridium estertheticum]MBU3202000.1 family 20 glycosylhydrolase [Clostridium estertheticum]WAG63294.1 family 20 glycosylhydrolase [Clostridium estertheticum]WAG65202.1 family 20 glycosylhydrolase [Clostridium estertheticum]
MFLIPSPKHLDIKEGTLQLKRDTEIVLDYQCSFDDLNAAILLQDEIKQQLGFNLLINKAFDCNSNKIIITLKKTSGPKEAYNLTIDGNRIEICGATSIGIFYGVQTLRQIIRQNGALLPKLKIDDEPYFSNRGFYHDVTRGKVPTLKMLMELVDRASFYKINQLQLYIEHTFAFKGMSEIWMDKDPLTSEEILILDQYCNKRHVELIPSLSTFGHMYEVLRSKSFNEFCELENSEGGEYSFEHRMNSHTLDATNEGSIKLVEKMLMQYIPLFSSNTFNICCDETFELGKGKSKARADEVGVGMLYVEFLNKVIDIVKKKGKRVMFWGDVILHHPELLSNISKDAICLNWDYNENAKEDGTRAITESGMEQYVCPGVWGWNQLVNKVDKGFENIKRMVAYGVKYGATGVLNTDWGDFGHINFLSTSIPGMAYGASLSWNPEGEKDFENVYKAISIIEYGDDSLKLVSLLNQLSKNQVVGWYELVEWKEHFKNDLDSKKSLRDLDWKKILEGYNLACEIENKFTRLSNKVRINTFDLQEFIVSARAIQLVDSFFLNLLKNEYAMNEINTVFTPRDLAENLEVWFYDFTKIWRTRNKESELYRIRDIISYTCKYLRGIRLLAC